MRRARVFAVSVSVSMLAVGGGVVSAQSTGGSASPKRQVPAAVAASEKERQQLENFGRSLSESVERVPQGRRPDRSRAALGPSARRHRGRLTVREVRGQIRKSAPDLVTDDLIVPPADEIQKVLGDRALRVDGPDGKGSQVMVSSMPVAVRTAPETKTDAATFKIANLDWEKVDGRFEPVRPVTKVSLPATAGGVVRFASGLNLRLADSSSTAEGEADGEAIVYPNIDTDTDLVVRSLPTGVGVGWSLRSPASNQAIRVPMDLPEGQRISTGTNGALSVVDAKGELVTEITPATAVDADGQSLELTTRVEEDDTIVYAVKHEEGTAAYPITVDPLYYDHTWGPADVDTSGWIGQNTPNTTMPFVYQRPSSANYQLGIGAPATTYMQGATAAWAKFAPGNPNVGTPQYGYARRISPEHARWTRFVAGGVGYGYVPVQYYHYYNYHVGVLGFGNENGATIQSVTLPSGTSNATFDQTFNGTAPTDGTIGFGLTNPPNQFFYQYDHPFTAISIGWYRGYATDSTPPNTTVTAPAGWVDNVTSVPVQVTDNGMGVQSVTLTNAQSVQVGGRSFTCPAVDTMVCPFDSTVANGGTPVQLSVGTPAEGESPFSVVGYDGGSQGQIRTFTLRVDRTAPGIKALNDTKTIRPDAPSSDTSAARTMDLEASDTHSGVKTVAVKIDGKPVAVPQPSCSGVTCPKTHPITLQAGALTDGQHAVEVTVNDQVAGANHQTKKTFTFTVFHDPTDPPARPAEGIDLGRKALPGLGEESWWTFDDVDTGAGSRARVNLATGNAVWSHTPVENPGIGLDTALQVTYNSFDPAGLLPGLLQPGGGLLGYGVAGRGFSVQLGSITRVNERLEIKGPGGIQLAASVVPQEATAIILTDGDGTQHSFTRLKDQAGVRFKAPAGVFLELRMFDSAAGSSRFWAATEPDGTTYFFRRDGLATETVDRHGNALLLEYDTAPSKPVCGVALDCAHRLARVVDQAGRAPAGLAGLDPNAAKARAQRTWTVSYDGEGRISTVTDRKVIGRGASADDPADDVRRETRFGYDAKGRLATLTENATGTAEQRRVFRFGYEKDENAFLTQVTDPRDSFTRLAYRTTPQDPLSQVGSLLGGLVGVPDLRPVESIDDRESTGGSRQRRYEYQGPATQGADRATWVRSARKLATRLTIDAEGRLRETVDGLDGPFADDRTAPKPRRTTMAWDSPRNRPQWVTRGLGTSDTSQAITTKYSWGDLGQLSSETEHKGQNTDSPDSGGPDSRTRSWEYRPHEGTLVGANDAGRGFVYDVTKATDRRGQATNYTYVEGARLNEGLVAKVDLPGDHEQRFEYNDRRLVERQITKRWAGTKPAENANEADETDVRFSEFDANGQPRVRVDERGQSWRSIHDEVGNTTSVADPRAGTTFTPVVAPEREVSDDPNSVTGAVAARGVIKASVGDPKFVARWAFDQLDREIVAVTPKQSAGEGTERFTVTATSYDKNDNPTGELDAVGNVGSASYSKTDQVLEERSPRVADHAKIEGDQPINGAASEHVQRYAYDADDNPTIEADARASSVDGTGYRTVTEYDVLGDPVVEVQEATGGDRTKDLISSRAFDLHGRVVGEADAKSNETGVPATNAATPTKQRTAFVYDSLGRKTQDVEDPSGLNLITRYEWDKDDNLTAEVTPAGRRTESEFDPFGDLIERREPFGFDAAAKNTTSFAKTTFQRRADGAVVAVTAPRGNDGTDEPGEAADDFTARYVYWNTGELRRHTLPRISGQYGSADRWKVTYGINEVGDPTEITDPRGNTFTNRFLDTGELLHSTRPDWWDYDRDTGVLTEKGPRGPEGTSDSGAMPEAPKGGDFGSVEAQQVPMETPAAGDINIAYDDELRPVSISSLEDSLPENADRSDEANWLTQRFTYDEAGRMTRRKVPFQGSDTIDLQWQYDATGKVRAEIDGSGAYRYYSYDDFGRLIRASDPPSCTGATCARSVSTQTYDRNGNVLVQSSPRENDATAKNVGGTLGTSETRYDRADRATVEIDEANARTESVLDPDGLVTTMYRPQAFLTANAARKDDFATVMVRDGAGRVIEERNRVTDDGDVDTITTKTTYDHHGNPIERRSTGTQRSSDSDAQDRVERVRYDARDFPWVSTTGSGDDERTRITEFDAMGNLVRAIRPEGVNGGHSDADPQVDFDNPDGSPQDRDAAGRYAEVRQYSPEGLLEATNLPWDPQIDKTTDAADRTRYRQRFFYTPRGMAKEITGIYNFGSGDGDPTQQEEITYNEAGWPTVSQRTDRREDTNTTFPSQRLEYGYDKQGNQVRWSSQGNSRIVDRTFYPSGQLKQRCGYRRTGTDAQIRREEQLYSYEYNTAGDLTKVTDWMHNTLPGTNRCDEEDTSAGSEIQPQTTTISRDKAGRPLQVDEDWGAGKDTEYSYIPKAGELVNSVKTDGDINTAGTFVDGKTTAFEYDELDRNVQVRVDPVGTTAPTRTTDLRWWPTGERRTIQKPQAGSGRTTEDRYYDTVGQLKARNVSPATDEDFNVSYEYDENGNRTKDERGTNTFNVRDQQTKWVRQRRSSEGSPTEADPAQTVNYTLDGAGNRREETTETTSSSNGFSVATKITTQNLFWGDQQRRSLRTIETTIDGQKQTTREAECHGYNVFGSMTRSLKKKLPADNTGTSIVCDDGPPEGTGWNTEVQYTYDTFERLLAGARRKPTPGSTDPEDPGVLDGSRAYCYDALDRRTRNVINLPVSEDPTGGADDDDRFARARTACTRTASGDVRALDLNYVGMTEQLSRDTRKDGTNSYDYTAAAERLGVERDPDTADDPTKWFAYETDAQGSVIGLEDPDTGRVAANARYETDPFGNAIGKESALSRDAQENPFRFQGFYKDQDTGLYDMQARMYRPDQGRFLQQDRFADPTADLALASDPLTSARYAFTAGNPSSRVEADGHFFPAVVAGIGARWLAKKAAQEAAKRAAAAAARRAAAAAAAKRAAQEAARREAREKARREARVQAMKRLRQMAAREKRAAAIRGRAQQAANAARQRRATAKQSARSDGGGAPARPTTGSGSPSSPKPTARSSKPPSPPTAKPTTASTNTGSSVTNGASASARGAGTSSRTDGILGAADRGEAVLNLAACAANPSPTCAVEAITDAIGRPTAPGSTAARAGGGGRTTVLGENMADRVIPYANRTGGRIVDMASPDAWARMSPKQRWKANDGALRSRIRDGDSFTYIGRDPDRPGWVRQRFDLTGSELLRMRERGIPFRTIPRSGVERVIGRP